MKQLYLLRHGEADWPNWSKPDDERPLTKEGRSEVKRVARLLQLLKVCPDIIATSPLPRAAQTARITADQLRVKLVTDDHLAPGFSLDELEKLVQRLAVDRLMIVGHEPDFSSIIRALTGGQVKMAKAGAAMVELNGSVRRGRLRWLFPPKFSKHCG